jgi:HK97 family phage prohead protease
MAAMEREIRSCTAGQRAQVDAESRVLRGHAAVFESETLIGGAFREVVDRRAFDATLSANDDVVALWNHDERLVLGRRSSGTLRLSVDDVGLVVEISVPRTATGDELLELVKRGDVASMSFGFVVEREAWSEGNQLRRLLQVRLIDVSPVTFPAYEGTDLAVRARDARMAMDTQAAERARLQMRVRLYRAQHEEGKR